MGMYDTITCQRPLPDDRVPAGASFQTKSLFRDMERLTISPSGRLVLHRQVRELDTSRTAGGGATPFGSSRRPAEDIDVEYHGDLDLVGEALDGELVRYLARFTHGTLESIRPFEECSALHKTWLTARD